MFGQTCIELCLKVVQNLGEFCTDQNHAICIGDFRWRSEIY